MNSNPKYEAVMGLEVHVELNTKSKMFCQCSADYFGKKPNTHTCPVCLGLPGAVPFINQKALEGCMKIGLALHCSINKTSRFERKNYFYPDLPKGYQISQLRWPLCVNGWIDVEDAKGEITRIRINRAHQEEDTGKLTHIGNETLIDYNRSSVPLVEIVTEPDFRDTTQIRDYAKKLQQIFRYLGVSNADMERGDMRLEANISVRPVGQEELAPYRVELKNINSFRFMAAAVEFEIARQTKLYEEGRENELRQETRGWNEDKKETYIQRVKEEANDYRYFPEPDLLDLAIADELIDRLTSELVELPTQKAERFINDYGISPANAKILTEDKTNADFFEELVKQGKDQELDGKTLSNYVVNQKVVLTGDNAQQILDDIKSKKSGIIDDETELEKIAKEVITENERSVADYKSGKEAALQALIGGMMRKTGGKAEINKAKSILIKLLL